MSPPNELKTKTSEFLLDLLRNYGHLIEYSLSVDLIEPSTTKANSNQNENGIDTDSSETNLSDAKGIIKSFDHSIDAKLLSIDLINTISSYFIQGNFVIF